MADAPEFDPSKPFQAVGSQAPEFDPSKPFQAGAAPAHPPIPDVNAGTIGSDVGHGLAAAGTSLWNTVRHPIDTATSTYHQVADTYNNTPGDMGDKGLATAVEAGKIGLSFSKLGVPFVAAAQGVDAYKAAKASGYSDDDAYAAGFHSALQNGVSLGAMHAAPPILGAAAGKVADIAGHAAASEVGVSPESIARYRADPAAVADAAQYVNNPEALKDQVDAKVALYQDAVTRAQQDVGDAKDQALNDKFSAQVARSQANQNAAEAYRAAKEGLDKAGAPTGMAGDIVDSLGQQGEKLGEMSSNAFDILGQEGHTFRAEDMAAAVDKQMKSLLIGGVAPAIGPDAAAFGALGQFRQMISMIGDNAKQTTGDTAVPAATVKQLIQTLDATSKAAYTTAAGALGPEAAVNLAQVRGMFNRALRDASPPPDTPTPPDQPPASYAEAMDRLAPQVQLTVDMSKVFGDEQKAAAALQAAGNPDSLKGGFIRQLLQRYDAANGTDFVGDLGAYLKSQTTLKSPTALAEFKQGLPEVQTAAGQLPEEEALARSQQGVASAQDVLAARQADAARFNKLGPNSTESVLKAQKFGRNIEARKQLEALDPELAQTAADVGVANQFQRSTTNGSRRTVLGGLVGGGIGHLVGEALGSPEIGRYVGAGVGGGFGFLADKYGGEAVKTAIDAGIQLDKIAHSKYIGPIMAAAKQGPQAVAVAHYLMSQRDPGYQVLSRGGDTSHAGGSPVP